MPITTTYVKYTDPSRVRKSVAPVTIEWKNAKMVRAHSIRITVREILNLSKSLDVVKINIIGNPSTGKTTLASTIAHLGHQLADIPYTIKKFTRDDLLNFEHTLSKLQPTNHILIFDDISFLTATASGRQIKQIEKAFTEIRHLPGGQDVKIIAIFNFHYNMGVSKYLRQSDFIYYTSIGSSELENTQKIIGVQNTSKIMSFRRVYQEAVTTGVFKILFHKSGKKFPYRFRQPFAPVFYWNSIQSRLIVSPKREWIDPICEKCANASFIPIKSSGDIISLDEKLNKEFKAPIIIQAMKTILFNMGVNVYPPRVKQCMTAIEQAFKNNTYSPDELATFYKLGDKKTRYDPRDSPKIWTGIK